MIYSSFLNIFLMLVCFSTQSYLTKKYTQYIEQICLDLVMGWDAIIPLNELNELS